MFFCTLDHGTVQKYGNNLVLCYISQDIFYKDMVFKNSVYLQLSFKLERSEKSHNYVKILCCFRIMNGK